MSSDAECTTMTATVEKVKKNVSPVRATPTSDDKSATAVVATPGIDATASVSPALAASKEVSLLTVQTEVSQFLFFHFKDVHFSRPSVIEISRRGISSLDWHPTTFAHHVATTSSSIGASAASGVLSATEIPRPSNSRGSFP